MGSPILLAPLPAETLKILAFGNGRLCQSFAAHASKPPPTPNAANSAARFLLALAQRLTEPGVLPTLNAWSMSTVARSYAALGCKHHGLLAAIARHALRRLEDFTAQGLATLLLAFAELGFWNGRCPLHCVLCASAAHLANESVNIAELAICQFIALLTYFFVCENLHCKKPADKLHIQLRIGCKILLKET